MSKKLVLGWPKVASTSWSILGTGKRVLKTGLVEIGEVHTHSPLARFLFDNHYINQPLGIENFFNNPNLLKLVNFFFDCIRMFLR